MLSSRRCLKRWSDEVFQENQIKVDSAEQVIGAVWGPNSPVHNDTGGKYSSICSPVSSSRSKVSRKLANNN
jgi:hypothetical protein